MEDQKENDLFFVCSLIEYIARSTFNTKKYIVETIGKDKIRKIYELAEVYHSENIDKVCEDLVKECHIKKGDYDILSKILNENPPSHWDMGRVYQRIILAISKDESEFIDKLMEVLTSWIIHHFDNYDSSLYFENPGYILVCYQEGKII